MTEGIFFCHHKNHWAVFNVTIIVGAVVTYSTPFTQFIEVLKNVGPYFDREGYTESLACFEKKNFRMWFKAPSTVDDIPTMTCRTIQTGLALQGLGKAYINNAMDSHFTW